MNASDLKIKSTDKGEYVYLLNPEKGRSTTEVLADELPQLISSLDFPKSMHFSSFEDGKFQFARPIRWIVALFGDEIIKIKVGRVTSDKYTFGHRFLAESDLRLETRDLSIPIEIKTASFNDYKEKLRKAGVIVDHNERREIIRQQVSDILKAEGCSDYIDAEILEIVTFLVEMPKPVVGTFSESYLVVPVEVLETAMKKHQRYFSLHSKDGENGSPLLPKFITITNGAGDDAVIRHGNERVLRSRLDDAQFFYNEDQKSNFAEKLERLNHVVFQEELGTLYDKSQRIKELAGFLCDEIGLDADTRQNAIRASELCKVDLVTQMVGEFPTLQGIMGGYYAGNSGENDDTAKAIMSHYKPNSPTDDLPNTVTGCIVSIADKLDTIVGYFATGNIPTGSQDPYALRRQAMGIVRIAVEKEFKLNLDHAIAKSIELYNQGSKIKINPKLADTIAEFLKGRISAILSDKFAYDIVDAILSVGETNATKILKRANVLAEFRKRDDFDSIYPALNRVIRILPDRELIKDVYKGDSFKINTSLFQDKSESDLHESITRIEKNVYEFSAKDNYKAVIDNVATICDSIDSFFDKVMIMVEQEDIKSNRLAMLYRIARMIYLVADISKLVV
ncbi:MAG: glycine--tRNA ligase subunit beta [Candidatus Poribacteria bacterium]